jgi:hypothetical protein
MHDEAEFHRNIASAASFVHRGEPMFSVRDMRQTVRWYASIGFTIEDEYEEGGELVFARASFGGAVFALSPGGEAVLCDARFWLYTSDVSRLYEISRGRRGRIFGSRSTCTSRSTAGVSSASATSTGFISSFISAPPIVDPPQIHALTANR